MNFLIKLMIVLTILIIIFQMKENYMNYKNCIVDGETYRCQMNKDTIYPNMKIDFKDSRYNRFQIPEDLKANKIKIEGYFK